MLTDTTFILKLVLVTPSRVTTNKSYTQVSHQTVGIQKYWWNYLQSLLETFSVGTIGCVIPVSAATVQICPLRGHTNSSDPMITYILGQSLLNHILFRLYPGSKFKTFEKHLFSLRPLFPSMNWNND